MGYNLKGGEKTTDPAVNFEHQADLWSCEMSLPKCRPRNTETHRPKKRQKAPGISAGDLFLGW